jgi:FixJ family two-component response regulator
MADPPNVFILDDEEQVCHVLRGLLGSVGLAARSYSTAQQFLDAHVGDDAPGCIVADVRLPGMSGLELQRHLASTGSLLPFVLISGHADVASAVAAMKAGAIDFLMKPFHPQQLLDAVNAAIRWNVALRHRRAERDAATTRLAALSKRERDVLGLLVTGHPNKIIATRLGISCNTVENHRAGIIRKTGAGHVAELCRLAALAGFDAQPEPVPQFCGRAP